MMTLIVFGIGWCINIIALAVFAALNMLAPDAWRRPWFWAALAIPGAYLLLAVALAWENIDRW